MTRLRGGSSTPRLNRLPNALAEFLFGDPSTQPSNSASENGYVGKRKNSVPSLADLRALITQTIPVSFDHDTQTEINAYSVRTNHMVDGYISEDNSASHNDNITEHNSGFRQLEVIESSLGADVTSSKTTAEIKSGDNVTYEIKPTRRILKFAKTRCSNLGISVCAISTRVYITDVYKNSIAWQLGLQIGDRLDEVNDIRAEALRAQDIIELFCYADRVKMVVTQIPLFRQLSLGGGSETDRMARQLGVAYANGQVQGVVEGSAGSLANMKKGDAVMVIGNEWVYDLADKDVLHKMQWRLAKYGRVSVTVGPALLKREIARACSDRPLPIYRTADLQF